MFLLTRANIAGQEQSDQGPNLCPESAPKKRRAATAMEYLMVISFILVVALTGIGYFGSMTKGVTQATSDAITKSVKKGG